MPPIPFGRYLLHERIARGGMAEIFLARDTGEAGASRPCVIKRLLPHLAKNDDFVAMFLDEARLAARLNHPGTVQIFDLGQEGDNYYLAIEYLPGEDGAQLLRRASALGTPVPFDVAAAIIARTAAALHYAHELTDSEGKPLGVVHRDVSPSNLFVTYQGAVKVLDFGIALAQQRLQRTKPGEVKGKAAYLAPEQVDGLAVDRRADVWGLGVCLWELITGKRLFGEGVNVETLNRVLHLPIPSPAALRPNTPLALKKILERTLQRDPGARYPTADQLSWDLDAYLLDRTQGSPAPDLGHYLRGLFGDERAQQKLALANAAATESGGQPTPRLGEPRPARVALDAAGGKSTSDDLAAAPAVARDGRLAPAVADADLGPRRAVDSDRPLLRPQPLRGSAARSRARPEVGGLVGTEDPVSAADEQARQELLDAKGRSHGDSSRPNNRAPYAKNILIVTSGKGGVGKSTVAVNVASVFAQRDWKVGLLDADVYGPSVPRMLQVEDERLRWNANERIVCAENFGIKVMSVGMTTPTPDTPLVWRASVATSAMIQMLEDVEWGALDLLVVDMPPGTGDTQLTMAQELHVTAALVVTTPQVISTDDVRRAIKMLQDVNIPIGGLVENLSGFVAPDTGKRYPIFGEGGGRLLADQYRLPFLGEIPIDIGVRTSSDAGAPIAVTGTAEQKRWYAQIVDGLLASERFTR